MSTNLENLSNKSDKKRLNLLIGVTGSVATIKLTELVEGLAKRFLNVNICIVPTKNSLHFIDGFNSKFNQQIPELKDRLDFLKQGKTNESNKPAIFSFVDEDEWSSWSKRSDPVLHIELRKWADVLLIAPLDANTMGKINNGLCDNLLTSIVRAWDIENINSKPIFICPAMNTCMYKHPITKLQLKILVEQFGFILIDSIEKVLMCGDAGIGAMALVNDIINKVFEIVTSKCLF